MPTTYFKNGPLILPSAKLDDATEIVHISWDQYRGKPPHFGRQGKNRFDCPENPARFGAFYAAHDLATALMESVFHDSEWISATYRTVTLDEVDKRTTMMLAISRGKSLNLADITAPGLMTQLLGMSTLDVVARNYAVTQTLAKQIHQMETKSGKPVFDGILYPSLKNSGAKCIVLFDRASKHLKHAMTIPLKKHRHWPHFVKQYGITIIED